MQFIVWLGNMLCPQHRTGVRILYQTTSQIQSVLVFMLCRLSNSLPANIPEVHIINCFNITGFKPRSNDIFSANPKDSNFTFLVGAKHVANRD